MKDDAGQWSRRVLLRRSSELAVGAMVAGGAGRLFAEELRELDVAAAGSMRAMLEGPFKTAIAARLKLDLRSQTQGADAVAQSLVSGKLRADVFLPITAGPLRTVMRAGLCTEAKPVARTEMVLTYSPKSRFTPRFEAAARGDVPWWEVLQEPGLRFVRSNPGGDPGGRNILFVMMLAAQHYNQPQLVQQVLGETLNPKQILGGNTQAMLKSGEVDASASYKTGPGPAGLPFITLPAEVNLSGLKVHEEHPEISLTVDGKTFYPEPLVFYAAALENAANPEGATAFIRWLAGEEAQGLFRRFQFDPPGEAAMLRG